MISLIIAKVNFVGSVNKLVAPVEIMSVANVQATHKYSVTNRFFIFDKMTLHS